MKKSLSSPRSLRLISLSLVLLLALGLTALAAPAAKNDKTPETVSASLRPAVTVTLDGIQENFFNAQGEQVFPILYNGSHYLPLRALGELMGKNVNWDAATLTISLTSPRTASAVAGTVGTAPAQTEVQVSLRPDFTVLLDGKPVSFADAQGQAVYPLLYRGTTYLPLRAVGELMQKTVDWSGDLQHISLRSKATNAALVTDADSFTPTTPAASTSPATPAAPAAQNKLASAEDAVKAACTALGLQPTDCRSQVETDREHGRLTYEVKLCQTKTGARWEVELDAASGAILSQESKAPHPHAAATTVPAEASLSPAQAKALALQKAGCREGDIRGYECELDYAHGKLVYEVSFHVGVWEYDMDIDAVTGAISDYERDRD